MLNEGLYWCERVGQGCSESSTGNPQVWIAIQVTHVAKDGNYDVIHPQDRKIYLSLTDAAMPYTAPKLKQLGFNGKFNDSIDFTEKAFGVEMKIEQYQGKPKEKWGLPYGGGEERPVDQQTSMALEAKWKNLNRPVVKAPGKPQAPKPRAAPAPESEGGVPPPKDDDIPY